MAGLRSRKPIRSGARPRRADDGRLSARVAALLEARAVTAEGVDLIARIAQQGSTGLLESNVLWYHAYYVSPAWGRRLARSSVIV